MKNIPMVQYNPEKNTRRPCCRAAAAARLLVFLAENDRAIAGPRVATGLADGATLSSDDSVASAPPDRHVNQTPGRNARLPGFGVPRRGGRLGHGQRPGHECAHRSRRGRRGRSHLRYDALNMTCGDVDDADARTAARAVVLAHGRTRRMGQGCLRRSHRMQEDRGGLRGPVPSGVA